MESCYGRGNESSPENSTWEMIELSKGKRTVRCKWVYTVKYSSDGVVESYKARLVAKGTLKLMGLTIKRPLLLWQR